MIGQSTLRFQITFSGKWAFCISLLMVFSVSATYRIQIAGLLVHPYLLVLPFAFMANGFNLKRIPGRVVVCLVLFGLVFSFAALQNTNPFSEIFKVTASLLTFMFFVLSVKTERDFQWISWALVLCAGVIGIQGFLVGEETVSVAQRLAGINVLEGIGNKNAQSLFTLPGVFLGSFLLIYAIGRKKLFEGVALATILFFIVVSIFLSANRSGWLGLLIVFVSIFFVVGVRGRSIAFALAVTAFSYLAIDNYAEDIFERKRIQTTEGYGSDEGRKLLMVQSLAVGLQNPLLGVGMDELHHQMAVRLDVYRFGVRKLDTHFLPGYLIGSSGLICFFLFFYFLITLCRKCHAVSFYPVRRAHRMIIAFVILFIVRSFFTREILYSPTFIAGLGLVYGYYLMQVRNATFVRR